MSYTCEFVKPPFNNLVLYSSYLTQLVITNSLKYLYIVLPFESLDNRNCYGVTSCCKNVSRLDAKINNHTECFIWLSYIHQMLPREIGSIFSHLIFARTEPRPSRTYDIYDIIFYIYHLLLWLNVKDYKFHAFPGVLRRI